MLGLAAADVAAPAAGEIAEFAELARLHGPAAAQLLHRHADAARLQRRHRGAARRPDRRRGAVGRRRVLPAQEHAPHPRLPRGRARRCYSSRTTRRRSSRCATAPCCSTRGACSRSGTPDAVLDYYNALIAQREDPPPISSSSATRGATVTRSGNGRARVASVELLDAAGAPARVFQVGESARAVGARRLPRRRRAADRRPPDPRPARQRRLRHQHLPPDVFEPRVAPGERLTATFTTRLDARPRQLLGQPSPSTPIARTSSRTSTGGTAPWSSRSSRRRLPLRARRCCRSKPGSSKHAGALHGEMSPATLHRAQTLTTRQCIHVGNAGVSLTSPLMPRALITGITGQDGSYLAELLLGQGLRGVRRRAARQHRELRAHRAPARPRLTLLQADLLDQLSLIEALERSAAGRGLQPRRASPSCRPRGTSRC